MPRVEWEAQQHLQELFEKQVDAEGMDSEATPSLEGDPDAIPMQPSVVEAR